MWKLLVWIKVPSEKELLNTAVLLGCIYTSGRDYPLDMNHHDRSGESASARKTVYPARRESSGSSTGGGGGSSLTISGSTSLNSNNLMLGDDYSPPVLSQSQTPATSSLGPQNPPQSLSIPLQSTLLPPTLPTAVAQMKKKSGFQITSVTPAQTSVSTNNSITEDTESCDDLDESHTEDLSSSEILDVSLSQANNAGGPERSYSEETLNNFHEADTPGAVSPNQPPILTQGYSHGTMVNGTIHHHHHHNHGQHSTPSSKAHPSVVGASGTQIGKTLGAAVTSGVNSSSGTLASTGQKMLSNVVGIIENASVGTNSVICQPLATVASGTGMISMASGASISTGNPVTSNVCMLNSASVPALCGISTNSSSGNNSPGLNVSNPNVNLTPIQSGIIGMSFTMATTGTTSTGVGPAVIGQHAVSAPSVPVVNAQTQQAQVPTPASTSSRFRVVKLDSTSEPFKKGRWTCAEYYDKEAPENTPSTRTAESIRQFMPENVVCLERDCVSGSSVSSSASNYTESLGSGEKGGPSAVQQQTFQQPPSQMHDYSSSNMPMSQMQPQDVVHAHHKTNAVAPMPVGIQQQAGLQTTIGLSSTAVPPHMPKLTYAQAAQSSSAQALPVVTQQQMGYPPALQPAAPVQVAPVGSLPPDFPQSKQIIKAVAPAPSQTLPHLATSIPPVTVSGNGQQPVGPLQTPAPAKPLPQGLLQPQQTTAPQMVQVPIGGVMPQLVQSAGTGLIHQTQGQQLTSHPSMEQQSQLSGQGCGPQFVPAVTASLSTSSVPHNIQSDAQSSLMQNGSKEAGPRPTVVPTLLEDAQLLLLQHQALLMQSKPASGECASQTGTLRGQEGSSGVNALTASASLLKNLPVEGEEDGSSGASVVAIDNKIEQAMDLVKSHLMYAVREEVEVLKEQIKELIERNSQLEQENNLLKNLASPEQLAQFQAQVQSGSPPSSTQGVQPPAPSAQLAAQNSGPSA
ncbi:TSC22 domain family protein 1 isoform X1 [Xyrauchen texanus]|uniref:TSC22 domain family protein 1 isoform X1 n=1 Tax=Xyrauchen texanus TaxID=154827 RepID=UPI002241D8E7|nr:TSC22 domain family protein 1 isoform X1 [Xyrauchen texanus]